MGTLHYSLQGNGEVIILLHGYLENSMIWNEFSNQLIAQYQVLTIDLPGHGKSQNYFETHTMEFMAEKVNEIMEIEKIDKGVFIGHSMGGYVALAFLELFPSKMEKLCLFFSTPLADDEIKQEQRLRAIQLAIKDRESYIKVSIPMLFSQHSKKDLSKEIEFAKGIALQTTIQGITGALNGMRIRKNRSQLVSTIEILWIAGTYDNAVPIQSLVPYQTLPNVQFHELSIGHMGYLEAPKECLELIKDWLPNKTLG